MSYSNGLLPDQSYQTANKYVQRGLPGVGFKLMVTGDYDMQNKKLTNVKSGTDSNDAVNKSQLDATTNLLHGSRAGDVVNDKAVIYSNTGAVHANSLYIEDPPDQGNSNEVRIMTEHQSYPNIHLNIPDLHNFDGHGGRPKSELMVTSVEQTVTGKKVFENIEVHDPTSNNQAANKSYADTKLSLTGGTMTGDLILPHHNHPIPGNTNKVINYESQREIFLSRQESFPMQADINMNNNFIQNIATPTSSHQATNKGYCDYNFLNRQKGGRIMGSLSMNQNDLFEIPAPKYESSAANKNYVDNQMGTKADLSKTTTQTFQGRVQVPDFNSGGHNGSDIVNLRYIDGIFLNKKTGGTLNNPITFLSSLPSNQRQIHNIGSPQFISSAANKQYVDGEIGKIAPVDTTQFIKKDGSVPMAADLDMGTHKISNVVNPEFDTDVVNKQYLENKLIESHLQPSGPSNIFHFLMNDTSKFSSIREIIIGSFSDVEKVAHRLNKKALSILLQNDLQTVSYSARLGLDMTSLSVGDYTLVMEFYWPEKFNIYTYADSTPTNIVDEQNIKNFSNYQKLYLQFTKKNTNSPNNLIMEIRGELSTSNQQTGYLIFYGTKGTHYSITNDFYDQYIMSDIFIYNENMKMQTKIDMNNNKIIKLSNGTDPDDAVNKGQLDSVNINLETFKNQINTFKIYFKNYFYLSIFTSHFYDLKEPSIFIFDGAAISGINPNMSIKSSGSSHITVSGFDPIRGLQFNSATKIIIDLGYMVNQNTPYTIMISLTLKDHLKVHFVEPTNEQTFYYPGYVVNPSDHTIRLHMSEIVFGRKIYPVVFNNKQIMIWIYFNPSERKYEIIIGNGNYVYRILNPLSYFSTNKLRIDANNNIINKICYQNQHFASAETFTKMMFEERKNGSYF